MINDEGLELLKSCEGCKLDAYLDPAGIWTIAYGSTRSVVPGEHITQEEADDKLVGDIRGMEIMVRNFIDVPLNSNQYSAILCLVYNIGIGNFAKSTLLHHLNKGEYDLAAMEFLRWEKIKGVVVPGLYNRRLREKALFEKPTHFPA